MSGAGMSTPDRGGIGEWSRRRERCVAVRGCCCALEVAAVGREQEPGPQHGGVQAALPLAVRCASRETGPTDLPQTCRAAAEGQLLQDPREIDITCPSRLRELGRRSQDMPRFATARLDPHPFFFFFSPRLPLVAASHTHLLPFLCPLSPPSAIGRP